MKGVGQMLILHFFFISRSYLTTSFLSKIVDNNQLEHRTPRTSLVYISWVESIIFWAKELGSTVGRCQVCHKLKSEIHVFTLLELTSDWQDQVKKPATAAPVALLTALHCYKNSSKRTGLPVSQLSSTAERAVLRAAHRCWCSAWSALRLLCSAVL